MIPATIAAQQPIVLIRYCLSNSKMAVFEIAALNAYCRWASQGCAAVAAHPVTLLFTLVVSRDCGLPVLPLVVGEFLPTRVRFAL